MLPISQMRRLRHRETFRNLISDSTQHNWDLGSDGLVLTGSINLQTVLPFAHTFIRLFHLPEKPPCAG